MEYKVGDVLLDSGNEWIFIIQNIEYDESFDCDRVYGVDCSFDSEHNEVYDPEFEDYSNEIFEGEYAHFGKIKATKLAKKMYPDFKEEDGYLVKMSDIQRETYEKIKEFINEIH